MLKKVKNLIQKYEKLLAYLVFGVLTTLVNYLVYLPCYNCFGLSSAASNAVAWAASVAFAFVTNKPFVYKSRDWSAKTLLPELGKFVGCRLGSGLLETLALFVAVDCLAGNGNIWKLAVSVLVVVLNYLSGKLVVFRNGGRAKN